MLLGNWLCWPFLSMVLGHAFKFGYEMPERIEVILSARFGWIAFLCNIAAFVGCTFLTLKITSLGTGTLESLQIFHSSFEFIYLIGLSTLIALLWDQIYGFLPGSRAFATIPAAVFEVIAQRDAFETLPLRNAVISLVLGVAITALCTPLAIPLPSALRFFLFTLLFGGVGSVAEILILKTFVALWMRFR